MGRIEDVALDGVANSDEVRPYITLTYAQSLDGSIAADRETPLTLSGRESLVITHQLRTEHDAILVGIGTILADNPRLTARLVEGPNPRPVILDSYLRTPQNAAVLQEKACQPLIVGVTSADRRRQATLEAAGAEVILLPPDDHAWVDLTVLLPHLRHLGITKLMVEGGARVITAFLAGCWVDRLIMTISPVFVGGQRAVEKLLLPLKDRSAVNNELLIDRFPAIRDLEISRAGRDLIVSGSLSWGDL